MLIIIMSQIIKYDVYIYLMIKLLDMSMDVLLLIYSFCGNNFIINKELYQKLCEGRENYYNNPIRIYYRLAEWKYTGKPNIL